MSVQKAQALITAIEKSGEKFTTIFEQTRIQWRRFGSGKPLLLIHGGSGGWLHWVHNIEALASQYTLWLPDLPGCGESQDLASPINVPRLAQALSQSIDSLIGVDAEVGIAGFSFGSIVAVHVAQLRGGVSRLALLGPTGHGLPREPLKLKNWRFLPPGPEQFEAHKHNLAQLMLHEPAAIDDLALQIHIEASELARLRGKKFSHTDVMRQAFDQLQIPTLMVWGAHDPTAHVLSAAQTLTDGHPHRRSIVIEGAGHWIQFERPAEVNALLSDWF